MKSEFLYFLSVITFFRLFYQWKDDSRYSIFGNLKILFFEIIFLLPLLINNNFYWIIILLIIYHLNLFIFERFDFNIFLIRIIEFSLLIFISSFIFGSYDFYFNKEFSEFIYSIKKSNIVLSNIDLSIRKIMLLFFSVLVLINEFNNIIRFFLGLLKTEPYNQEKKCDNKELGKGKIIGILERILFFFFVITGNYASIGFILTAKGITRFKNLNEKDFAEYVLIGTLLSSSIAIFWGYFIKIIL